MMLALAIAQLPLQSQSTPAQQPEILFREANAAYERGDVDQAIRSYQNFLKLRPDSVEARTNLGAALAHAGRYDEAVLQYKQALKRDPENAAVRLDLALARYKQADFNKAAAEFEHLRVKHPENNQTLYLLADCYLRLGKNQAAIALLQPSYDAGPEDRAVEFALGMALLRDGQTAKAEAMIGRVMKGGTSAEVDLLMGAAQLAAGDAQARGIDDPASPEGLARVAGRVVFLRTRIARYRRNTRRKRGFP